MRRLGVVLMCLLLLAILVAAVGCGGGGTAPTPLATVGAWTGDATVQTLYGSVRGFEGEGATVVWKAIPYARPPVGELRWKAPRDPEPWAGTREETGFCSECAQYDLTDTVIGGEDCLYLNIWRPESTETDLPVYFWIHGGGNSGGSASDAGYDGANIAAKSNMVVVTVNYRLGPMGWFTHGSLRSGAAGAELDDSGNYGTLDLIQALRWVQDNIEAFGGDPDSVTIAGESAGAINIFSLLVSPLAENLFHRAIAQSGFPVSTAPEPGEESARSVILKLLVNDGTAADEEEAVAHLNGMSASEVEAYLRSKTAADLLAGHEKATLGMLSFPFIFEDGTVIPDTGFASLEDGTYPNKVPLIVGSNKEETKLFLFLDPYFVGKDELYQTIASYSSDLWKAIGVDGIARELSAHEDQPDVYVYQFLWGAGGEVGESVLPDPWGFRLGSFHSLDIPFFFGNDDFYGPLTSFLFTEDNQPGREALSAAIMAYAAEFARTGDPNPAGGGLPQWEPWTNDTGEPKCILLDADRDELDIKMSAVELTQSSVKEEMMASVPQPLQSETLEFLLRFVEGLWDMDLELEVAP